MFTITRLSWFQKKIMAIQIQKTVSIRCRNGEVFYSSEMQKRLLDFQKPFVIYESVMIKKQKHLIVSEMDIFGYSSDFKDSGYLKKSNAIDCILVF
ncbi:hypothetical protein MADA3029_1150025 [Vibrio nigripulchritudo MADA3029]|nr:hypothetical protein VIBNIMADA3020_630026 [Vibrio nigripulchritudo MADA3020]CCN51457.1 hypothetical protein VIBNIMADA3021_1080027 [Vibrio nigripulchritudo MADA3021]CCN57639.1 hypothetical protein MADA3029_1150025 [Vibrio nigripulchritudo MADA3029]